MSGGGAETGATGIQAVMGEGRGGCGGYADGGLGGRTDGGGGGDRKDGDRDGRLIRWDHNVENLILGTETNDLLAYTPGLEPHRLIVSILGGHGERLEREIEISHLSKSSFPDKVYSWFVIIIRCT